MDCPRCNRPIIEIKLETGDVARFCDVCGWGKEAVAQRLNPNGKSASANSSIRPDRKTLLMLMPMWAVSLALVFGPYVFLVYGREWFAGNAVVDALPDPALMADKLNPYYWAGVAAYLMLSAVWTPQYDSEDLGWFGGLIDIPFHYSDNWNRMMLYLSLVLWPGKLVWVTLRNTYYCLRALASGG